MYPRLLIDERKFCHNAAFLLKLCKMHDIEVCAVNKVSCGSIRLAWLLFQTGIREIGDARIENLRAIAEVPIRKRLIRLPMLSEVADVVRYADCSLVSSTATLLALSAEAEHQHRRHDVLLMLDTGDRREGVYDIKAAQDLARLAASLPGLRLEGLGTNLSCYGAVIPDERHIARLLDVKASLPELDLPLVSGGNSSSLHLLDTPQLLRGVNHLRLGTSLFFGLVEIDYKQIVGMYDDVFNLEAEIVELETKPSMPDGEIGIDAFGERPDFVDRGLRRRALLAIGKQDVDPGYLFAHDPALRILGGSSDYLLVDVHDSRMEYRVGDVLRFTAHYVAVLRMMTSAYVHKEYIPG